MQLSIEERRTLEQTLLTQKVVDFDGGFLELPVKANRVDALREGESMHPSTRGCAEAVLELSAGDLGDIDPQDVAPEGKSVSQLLECSLPSELTWPVVNYTGRSKFTEDEAADYVEFLDRHFGIVSVPLVSEQVDAPDDVTKNPGSVNRHLETVDRIIRMADERASDAALVGTIPALPWQFVEQYLEVYIGAVDGLYIDFLGKKPTAKTRVTGFISNLMEELGKHQIHRKTVLYGLNAHRGNNRTKGPRSPAEDFLSVGLGIDIIGGKYYHGSGSRIPVSDHEPTFRVFHADSWEQEYVTASSVQEEINSGSGFGADRLEQCARDPDDTRLEFLYESEQMNVAFNRLREAMDDDRGRQHVMEKTGVTNDMRDVMLEARRGYDEGASSPALSSF